MDEAEKIANKLGKTFVLDAIRVAYCQGDMKDLRDCGTSVSIDIATAMRSFRDEALEEAARHLENEMFRHPLRRSLNDLAKEIRALKTGGKA